MQLRTTLARTLAATLLASLGCQVVGPLDVLATRTREERFFDWTRLRFSPEVYAGRRERLAHALAIGDGGGGVFLTPSAAGRSGGGTFRQLDDFLYLTGLELPDAVLAIDAEAGTTNLFVPAHDARFASASRPNDFPGRPLGADPELARVSGLEALVPVEEFEARLAAWCDAGRVLRLRSANGAGLAPLSDERNQGLDPHAALLQFIQRTHPNAALRDAHDAVASVRLVKGPEEIAVLRRAAAITARGIEVAASYIADGVTERELEAELEAAFKRRGAQRLAFDSIIKSGPNSLWPWRILASHYDRRNRAMRAGELVIFDVGCELDHHASDVGRTFPVSGRFSPEQRAKLALSTAASDAVIAAIRPGITFAELREVALAAVPAEERRYMQTGLFFGHHIGLAVGDPSSPELPLAAGMVFTVEPWYYNHDEAIAVFIEDVVLVTAGGAENLTAGLARSPEALERLVDGSKMR